MSGMDLFDDIIGPLDILDWLQSWVSFAFAPYSKRSRHGRLNLVTYSIPRADKVEGAPSLGAVREHLAQYGVRAEAGSFNAREMKFQVRRDQQVWAERLLAFDGDGVPRLWRPARSWKDPKPKTQSTKRGKSKGFLAQLFGL